MSDQIVAPDEPQEDEADILSGSSRRFDAAIASSDWTTETVLAQLRKGNIHLDPSFQRRQAWKDARKSKFIESLILGIPTPQIILAERQEKKGTYIVIDGKQRLLTLRQFSASENDANYKPFRLTGLEARPDLNGMNFNDLHQNLFDDATSALDNATIRSVIIRSWPDEGFLYEVFLRINSGSVQLSPQELRQALHPGEFTNYLNEYVLSSDEIRMALGLREPDFRMRDNEIALRYVAFDLFFKDYRGNLKKILDDTTFALNKDWDRWQPKAKSSLDRLDRAIRSSFDVFGSKYVFRKWNGERFEGQFNRAIFDVQTYYMSSDKIAAAALENSDAVIQAFKDLCDEPVFNAAVSGTTKSIDAVNTRFALWGAALEEIIGFKIKIPQIVN